MSALAGRRVVEIADEKGVYCGKLLADMGADVVKVETPGGDPTRRLPPFVGGRAGTDRGYFFLYMNTSKRGVTLDLSRPSGAELFRRLVGDADVVIETLAPGRLDALGLGYQRLAADHPSLVLTSITDFGQTGPRRQARSSDLVASALGGAMAVTGSPEDPPVTLAGSQSYVMASAFAAAATMIALYHSAGSGHGQHVDIAALETTVSTTHVCGIGKWLEDGLLARRFGTGLFASVPSGAYRCRDGLVYLMVNRPLHWKALAAWINEETGNQEVLDPMFEGPSSCRQPYRELLDIWIAELTSARTVEQVYHEGQRRHIAFTPVNTPARVATDEHLAARGYFVEVDHPELGPLACPGAPFRPVRTPWRISRAAPAVGEHNREVYCDELGLTRERLTELEREGAV